MKSGKAIMQPEEEQLDVGNVGTSTGSSFYEQQQPKQEEQEDKKEQEEEGQHAEGSEGRRTQRAAAAKATDRGKLIAEMILECNEDGDQGEDDAERDASGENEEASSGSGAGDDDARDAGAGAGAAEDADANECDGGANGSLYRRKPIKTRWSTTEDTELKQLVDTHGSGNWKMVSVANRQQ